MVVPIIKKRSDRLEAVSQRRALQTARNSLAKQQNLDKSKRLQDQISALDAQIAQISAEISRYDGFRNFCVLEDQDGLSATALVEALPGKLIEARMRKRISLRELAERTGMQEAVLCRSERSGYEKVSLSRLKQIATALDSFP